MGGYLQIATKSTQSPISKGNWYRPGYELAEKLLNGLAGWSYQASGISAN